MNCDRGDCNSCWTANPLDRTPKRERMRPTNSMDSCYGLLNRSMTVSERDIPAILATAKAPGCSGPSQTLIPARPDAGKHHHAFVHSIGPDLPIAPDEMVLCSHVASPKTGIHFSARRSRRQSSRRRNNAPLQLNRAFRHKIREAISSLFTLFALNFHK
jgi:hypothetical protein